MAEKIGVYIDESSVAPLLNAEELVAFVKEKCGGACPIVKSHKRLSSEAGLAMIKADVAAGEIDAVLICGTSPRVDWEVFDFGDKVLVDRVNLREFAVLSYKNPNGSAMVAGTAVPEELASLVHDYLRMGVVKMQKMNAPHPELPETNKTILVLGGGWTGIHAALSAAAAGYEVILIEKTGVLGGKAAGLYKTFPLGAPYLEATETGLDRLIGLVDGNAKIKVRLNTTLKLLAGAPGLYEATLASAGKEETLPIGSVVLAAGWTPMDTEALAPFGYGTLKNVITSAEFEAMVKAGGIKRPSDGKTPASVAFLVDVTTLMAAAAPAAVVEEAPAAAEKPAEKKEGEEEEKNVFCPIKTPKHLAYASELTSLVALKQANYVREKLDDAVAMIVYDNMMVPGLNERYYRSAQDNPGIMLTKGTVTGVTEEGTSLIVSAKDTLLGGEISLAADLVVVPTGMVPVTALDPTINLLYRQGPAFPDLQLFDGFADSNYICFPYETRRTGVYAAGCVRQPMDINTTYDSKTQKLKIASGSASKTGSSTGSSTSTYNSSTSSTSSTDSTSWSSIAKALSNTQTDYISPILQYKSQNEILQQQLTKSLATAMTNLGIDTTQPITLSRDSSGNVVVDGDNADKDKIEKMFKDNSTLTEAFNTLADNSTVLKNMTSQQAGALVRSNGYAAYLQQLTSDSSSSDFFMSVMSGVSSIYFK